jgi:hypothetical protein
MMEKVSTISETTMLKAAIATLAATVATVGLVLVHALYS